MFKYNGYLIVTEPDYKAETAQGKVVDDLWCQVYDENDIEHKQMLGDFNLVRGASFNKSSVEAIEKTIMEVVEEDQAAFELVRKTNELDKYKGFLKKSLEVLESAVGLDAWPIIIHDEIGMAQEELDEIEEFGNDNETGMNNEEGMKMM